jgi:DNA-binding GntR family transcriptional regulator
MAKIASTVYEQIRTAILSGELSNSERLVEEDLAVSLGISRTPVREALRRLAAEGLVDVSPNRGARVAEWDADDLREIFDLRSILESHA